MSTRREAREWIVQILFQLDLNASDDMDSVFANFWADKKPEPKVREFTESIVRGTHDKQDELDGVIEKTAEHWDIHRMGVLDRNVLRMAVYEMFNMPDIPPVVSINEAVDIAKYFSNAESGRFVNGILDRIRKGLDRPARRPDVG